MALFRRIEAVHFRHPRLLPLLALCSLPWFCVLQQVCADESRASGPAEPARLELSPELLKKTQRCAYGVYMRGQKIGFAVEEMKPAEFKGQPAYEVNNKMVMVMQSFGETSRQEFSSLSSFSRVPPYQLLEASEVQKTDKFSSKLIATLREKNRLLATITAAGDEKSIEVEDFQFDLVDALSPTQWILNKPGAGDSIRFRAFDFSELEKDVESMTILELKEIDVLGEKRMSYVIEFENQESDLKGTITVDDTGRVVRFELLGVMEMKLEKESKAMVVEGKFDAFESGIIRPDKQLGDPTELALLQIELSGAGLDKLPNGFGQKVVYDPEKKTAVVTLGPDAGAEAPEATPEEIKEALKATVSYPVNDERVKKLARRAVRNATTDEERVRKLVKFVDRYIRDEYGIDPLTVEDVIKEKRGDCSEHAALFATLGRAAGIPTREVSGVIYGDVELEGFGGHAWNEVVLDGKWYPVDPTWDEFNINATHIKFGHGNKKDAGLALLLGDLKMKVLKVQRKKSLGGAMKRLLRDLLE